MTKHLDIIGFFTFILLAAFTFFLREEMLFTGRVILYSVATVAIIGSILVVSMIARMITQQGEAIAMSGLNVVDRYYQVRGNSYDADTKRLVVNVNGNVWERNSLMLLPTPQIVNQLNSSSHSLSLASPVEVDENKLFDTFRKAKAIHGLVFGSKNGGKSTLVNRLMNEEFVDYEITIIDNLFNKVDSGWVLHENVKVSKELINALTEFYQSHKKLADLVDVSRGGNKKRLLVIDEFPTLVAHLRGTEDYDRVMAMLRDIYSQGSHTNHNLILLSQTVLTKDIGLSSNDKCNFIQIAIGGLAGDFLSLRRGKAHKDKLYEKLASVASEYPYYACFEDGGGNIDIQPLPDLSKYGAKRKYGTEQQQVDVEDWQFVVKEPEVSKEEKRIDQVIAILTPISEQFEYHKTGKVNRSSISRALGKSVGGNDWHTVEEYGKIWDTYKEKQ